MREFPVILYGGRMLVAADSQVEAEELAVKDGHQIVPNNREVITKIIELKRHLRAKFDNQKLINLYSLIEELR